MPCMTSRLNAEYTLSLRVAGTVPIRCGCDKEERVCARIRYPLLRVAVFGKNSSTHKTTNCSRESLLCQRILYVSKVRRAASRNSRLQQIVYSWYVCDILAPLTVMNAAWSERRRMNERIYSFARNWQYRQTIAGRDRSPRISHDESR